MTRDVQVSKKLSWLLRHGATSENLALDGGGYARVADVLANPKLRSLKATFAEVRDIVRDNDKQRFALKPRDGADEASADPGDWLIRANQGHSVKVESEGLLEPVTVAKGNLPEMVVHGTSRAAWTQIVASGGLRAMGRNHVHFAAGLPSNFKRIGVDGAGSDATADGTTTSQDSAAPPVISGMRTSSTVLIYIALPRALEAGIKFWRSENGVVLSEGDAEGKIGMEFFERVEDRTGKEVLVLDGKVVKEAPAAWATEARGGGRGRGQGRGRGRGGGRGRRDEGEGRVESQEGVQDGVEDAG